MAGLKYSTDGSTWKTLKNYTIKNVDVLQSTGESTEGVMSQKAVTDALAVKADTSALGEYVKETEITEKVTEIVKTETSTGEVKSAIEAAVADKANKTELATLFDGAEYTTGTLAATEGKQVIAFKHGATVLAEVDATDFIKDGMVEKVELTGGKLIITWNAASGKQQATEIEVSEIFNAENYYDKTAADAKFATKTELNGKANSATTLAGYGITDAKIADGVITLGSNTITPITSLAGVLKGTVIAEMITADDNNYTVPSLSDGEQKHIIFVNNGSKDYTITMPSTSSIFKSPDGEQMNITVPNGGFAEVNFMKIGTVTYVRGI